MSLLVWNFGYVIENRLDKKIKINIQRMKKKKHIKIEISDESFQ